MAFDEPAARADAARRHRWRRIRTSTTLLVLVVVVVGAAWYSWRSVTEDEEPSAVSTSAPCVLSPPTEFPQPADVQVNVYNATDRTGLASSVARELRSRGYTILAIDNDPLDKTIDGPAEVRSSQEQLAAASLVASLVPGSAYLADDRTRSDVDLVLGEAFAELAPADAPVEPVEPVEPVATGLPTCATPQ